MERLHDSQKVSQDDKANRTPYGTYEVRDTASFVLPNNEITLERASADKFLYKRTGKNGTVEKILTIRTGNLEMEVVPTMPVYIPSYKTDFVFLRLDKPVFVSRNSATEIFASVPIEIGLFFTGSEIREYFDVFACEASCSRYALYGQPDKGKLCKFAVVTPHPNENEPVPYVEGGMRIIIQNELETGISVGKVVLPIRDHDISYHGINAVYDDLKLVVKERLGVQIAEILQQPRATQKGWQVSPRTMKKTDIKFTMEMGFD